MKEISVIQGLIVVIQRMRESFPIGSLKNKQADELDLRLSAAVCSLQEAIKHLAVKHQQDAIKEISIRPKRKAKKCLT